MLPMLPMLPILSCTRKAGLPATILSLLLSLLGSAGAAESKPADTPAPEKKLYVIGTAHLDTQWHWTVQDTINKHIPSTLNGNFALFEKYPSYVFSFEGAFRYMLMREYYPKDWARLKNYVARGQWRVAGSSVDAGDVNVPSPESLMRQILYGNGFFRREFNRTSLDIFLPDCFGFGYALPSVAAHCGLKGFSSQKLSWGAAAPIPFDIGRWEGPDGASIVAALDPGSYVSKIKGDLSGDKAIIDKIDRQAKRSGAAVAYKYFGVGDIGGAPDPGSVEWLEKSIHGQGPVKVVSAASDQLYRDLTPEQVARLPRHKGELLMSKHGAGCYTAQAPMKRWNRKNERLADAAERAAVGADWLGALPYPRAALNDAWTRFLWHQFHDDLTGTSNPDAYRFSWNDELLSLNQFSSVLTSAASGVARALDTRGEGTPIVVYNPLSIEREDIVRASIHAKGDAVTVRDGESGKIVPSQTVRVHDGTIEFLFLANGSPVGSKVFDVTTSASEAEKTTLKASATALENERYKIDMTATGDIAQIFDKTNKRALLKSPLRLELLDQKTPHNYGAWEIDYEDVQRAPRMAVGGPAKITVLENGPLRATLEVRRQVEGSTVTQRISLMNGGAQDRIEIANEIDWRTRHTLLKAAFPLAVENETATYDLGLGAIQRGNNRPTQYEVPAQQWADLTGADARYGVAILNDCKYGWDKPDSHTLRLTLLHNPKAQWLDRSTFHQETQEFGHHRFTYAIYGHEGNGVDKAASEIAWQAARLNQPLVAFIAPSHAGPLGKSFSLARVSTPQVAVRALKRAEQGDEVIVRLQNLAPQAAGNVTLAMAAPIAAAREVNGAEDEIGKADVEDGKLRIAEMSPYQPRTFALKLAPPKTSVPAIESVPCALPFNLQITSADGEQCTGGIDGQGHAIPAELWPEKVTFNGIEFKLGPAAGMNTVACDGQTIALPAGARRLDILAADAGGPKDAVFKFEGNPKGPVTLKAQPFAGPIGQADSRLVDGQFYENGSRITPGFIKRDPVAWVATHRHDREGRNEAYVFSYVYGYELPLPEGAKSVTLPAKSSLRILAAAATQEAGTELHPVQPLYD